MLITLSGLSGSGKSTAARTLAKELAMPTVDIGEIFRALAKKHGMDVVEFGKHVEKNPEIDHELDQAMVRRAKRGKNLILQGRLAGWMTKKHDLQAIRVWISATPQTRASRIAKREGIPYKQALTNTVARDRRDRRRYKAAYGLDLNDLSIYDIVVRTDTLSVQEVVDRILKQIPYGRRNQAKRRPGNRAGVHGKLRPRR